VPAGAVVYEGGRAHVWVERPDGAIEARGVLGPVGRKIQDALSPLAARSMNRLPRVTTRSPGLRPCTALRQRVLVLLLFAGLLAVGYGSFRMLNIEAYPDPSTRWRRANSITAFIVGAR
jgi:hypothetical protein